MFRLTCVGLRLLFWAHLNSLSGCHHLPTVAIPQLGRMGTPLIAKGANGQSLGWGI